MEVSAQPMTTVTQAGVKEQLQQVVKGRVKQREQNGNSCYNTMPILVMTRINAHVANVLLSRVMKRSAQQR
jgi:hypothetical protein